MNKNFDNKKPQRNQKIKTLETSDLMYFACVSHSQDVNFLLPPQCPLLPTVHRIPAYQCKKNSALQQFVFSQCDFSSVRWSISPKIKKTWTQVIEPQCNCRRCWAEKNWKWSTLIGTESAWNSETEKLRRGRIEAVQMRYNTHLARTFI